jgi:hypothetical protein
MAIAFYSVLKHWKGEWAGQTIQLEPAQQFWIASLFGWKNADGKRRFRTAYLEVGRKNAKTTTAAGIGLWLAFADGEGGADGYSAATKRDQAKIVHKDATEMVKRSPQLRKDITIFRYNLHSVTSGSKFEPLSSDYDSLDGLNVHGVIADELHAWPSQELWGVLLGYYLLLYQMVEMSSHCPGVYPSEMSFTACTWAILGLINSVCADRSGNIPKYLAELHASAPHYVLPHRREERVYPRAIRLKSSKYPIRNKNASQLN